MPGPATISGTCRSAGVTPPCSAILAVLAGVDRARLGGRVEVGHPRIAGDGAEERGRLGAGVDPSVPRRRTPSASQYVGAVAARGAQPVVDERRRGGGSIGQPHNHRVVVDRMHDQLRDDWVGSGPFGVDAVDDLAVVDAGEGIGFMGAWPC